MEILVVSADELRSIISNAISKALIVRPQLQQLPDRCTLDEAVKITGLSKSKLYKLTSLDEIPNKKFGNRLIFSRKELKEWIESQTVEKTDSGKACLLLAKSARNKIKRG